MSRYLLIIPFFIILSCNDDKEKEFDTIQIGKQIWMKKNLDVVTFRNGDTIPEAKSEEDWNKARHSLKPAWCYAKNNLDTDSLFGKLYNWYAVTDPRGLAPEGWHVPTDNEWNELTTNNNGLMFSMQRPGIRSFAGYFENDGWAFWWSTTGNEVYDKQYAWYRVVGTKDDSLHRDTYVKGSGFSVRCIKDTK
jgi:hypothetical protein